MTSFRRAIACLAAATAVVAATPAICADAAPNPHSLELARKMFANMHMEQLMSGMMRQMAPAMTAQMRKSNPSLTDADAQAISDAVSESMGTVMAKVEDRMIPIYASTFTTKELQDVVDFYGSPSGQAMLAKMPILMAKMGPTMAEMMPEMTADIQKRICSKIDCTKRGGPLAPKT
jgi:hypothetical protein